MNFDDFKDFLSQMIVIGGALGIAISIMLCATLIVCKLLNIPFS